VDNGPLKGFGDELRRDLVAERDYVLLPQSTANMLLDVFGGGPKFSRHIRMVDDSIDRSIEVELWPVRVHLYLCDSSHPTPEPQGPQFRRLYYRWDRKLQDAVKDAQNRLFSAYVTTPIRCWLRETPPKPEALDTDMGRRLTNDMVEWGGDWHVIRSAVMGRRMKDIRGDADCIELIIEVAPSPNPKPSDWPRFHLLEAWKRGIRMGDMIDARDAQGHFKAATVIQVSEVGDVVVRYWTGGVDEWILTKDFEYRFAPLHSYSSATSVPTVDMTAPCTLGKRPPATTSVPGGVEENHDSARLAKVNRGVCGELSRSGSGSTTPPLTVSEKVPMEAAHVVLGAHLRRALQAYGITTSRVEAVLQVLRDEEVSSLTVWQALSAYELSSLLETHRATLPLGLRTAMRLIHETNTPL
jgi:hypothetical protein